MKATRYYHDERLTTFYLFLLGVYAEAWVWAPQLPEFEGDLEIILGEQPDLTEEMELVVKILFPFVAAWKVLEGIWLIVQCLSLVVWSCMVGNFDRWEKWMLTKSHEFSAEEDKIERQDRRISDAAVHFRLMLELPAGRIALVAIVLLPFFCVLYLLALVVRGILL